MSPSWRERQIFTLSRERVRVARYARGWRPRLVEQRDVACRGSTSNEATWQPALDALRDLLAGADALSGDGVLVLGSPFVRYALVPWNAAITKDAEILGVAHQLFIRQFGDGMERWDVRVSMARAGANQLSAAVEADLLQALATLFKISKVRLTAVEPRLMTIVNAHRRSLQADAWLVVREKDQILLGFLRNGDWLSLRARPALDGGLSLAAALEQEALLHGFVPVGEKIYVYDAGSDGGMQPLPADVQTATAPVQL